MGRTPNACDIALIFLKPKTEPRRTSEAEPEKRTVHIRELISSQPRSRREACGHLEGLNLPTPSLLAFRTALKGLSRYKPLSQWYFTDCCNKLNHQFTWICLLTFFGSDMSAALFPGLLTSRHLSPAYSLSTAGQLAITYNTCSEFKVWDYFQHKRMNRNDVVLKSHGKNWNQEQLKKKYKVADFLV